MSDKHFVGLDITGFENNGKTRPISRVTLLVDSENAITAGDDTGMELVADCPHATQTMVDTILAQVKGYQYQMYSADDANLDPAAELGDGATVNGVYSVIARIDDDGSGYSSISAPGEEELEDEYPSSGPMTQEFDRKIATTRSLITKTAEQIRLEVANEVEGLSSSFTVELDKVSTQIESELDELSASFTVSLDGISAEIESMDGRLTSLDMGLDGISAKVTDNTNSIAALDLYVDSLTLSVSNGSTSSVISLKAGSTTISSQNITMSGLVTYTGLANGTTTINGGCIQTGTIDAEYLNLTGAIKWSSLSSSMQTIVDDIETTANEAYNMADSAYDMALDTGDIVSDWSYTYRGTTYIDGTQLMTGTVTASTLQGGTVYILNEDETRIGYITVGSSTSDGLQLVSRGNLYFASRSCDIQMEDDEISVVCSYFYPRGSAPYLGYSGLGMWEAVYSYTGDIQVSDLSQKNSVIYGLEAYDKFFDLLAAISFLFNTGTSGRRHFGLGAQDVEQALADAGLTSMDFAGLIKSPRLDDEGQEIEGEYDYALRYAEFIPLLIDQVQKLKKRVNELEAAGL